MIFIFWIVFICLEQKKIEFHKKVCKKKFYSWFYNAFWRYEDNKPSDKAKNINHADLESLIEKIDGFKNNTEKSFKTKVGENISCGFQMSTIWTSDSVEIKDNMYKKWKMKNVLLFTDMMKANNKYMKDFDKNKESSHPNHSNSTNLYGWAMSHKSPVDIFKWVETTPQFSKKFVEK